MTDEAEDLKKKLDQAFIRVSGRTFGDLTESEVAQIQQAIDRAFLKRCARTFR